MNACTITLPLAPAAPYLWRWRNAYLALPLGAGDDAGYCLDRPEIMPAGAYVRLDPPVRGTLPTALVLLP